MHMLCYDIETDVDKNEFPHEKREKVFQIGCTVTRCCES